MLSRFVIAFLPRSKCLLILQLQSLFAVLWEPKKIKSVSEDTIYTVSVFISIYIVCSWESGLCQNLTMLEL